jgi:hypothetical protein
MAQDRACELGEEALDEVEPGAVFGGEGEREAARRLSSEPGLGFSGDMRRVVVQAIATSVRDRETAINRATSSSVIPTSRACRHVAMLPLLVQFFSNEESTNIIPVP